MAIRPQTDEWLSPCEITATPRSSTEGNIMTILTIDEAACILRVTKRTLYRLRAIPRVRIGHRIMFLQEDIEGWVKSRRDTGAAPYTEGHAIDGLTTTVYHRNPIFQTKRNESR